MEGNRRKIILVDDINLHLLSTKDRLKSHYEVYPAQTAEKLFEILNGVMPDLILLDINMPYQDGYYIIEKLKSSTRFVDIPVIFLTGKRDKESVIKGLNSGAADMVFKPYSTEELIKTIEHQLDPVGHESPKPMILAVDDSPSILQTINYALHDMYRVYTMSEPEKLKKLLEVITPDLFLMDCKMPVLSGFELVPIIRRIPAHEETPIVFLTSEGTVDHVSVALGVGANDFLVKPIDEEVLRQKVALHLRDYKALRLIRTL
ncbi:MAG: response regulator [Oscillospiraceae bacterium]|nr:response regulator [Oscillospiraceae bacterium]